MPSHFPFKIRLLSAAALLLAAPAAGAATYTIAAGADSGDISVIANGALSYVSDQPVEIQVKNTASGAAYPWSLLAKGQGANDNRQLVATGSTIRIVNHGSATANVDLNVASSGSGPSYGTAGSASSAVGTVQGISGGTPVPVTISGGGGTVPTGTAGSPNAAVVSMQGVSGGTAVPISGNVGITGTPAFSISGTPAVSISGVTPSSGAIPVDGSAVAQPTVGYAINPSASFTRPANTTTYAVGNLVANSTTAGSVSPLSLTAGRVSGGSFMIRRVKLHKSGATTTNASFRVHFFRSAPSVSAGDGAANAMTGAANYLGACDVVIAQAFSDGAAGFGVPNTGSDITIKLASGTTIYALVEAMGAYAPASGETITLTLEDLQN